MRIPKYEWFLIQFDKLTGYIVLWQGRVVAVFKTLQAAKVWIRKALSFLRYMQRAKLIYATEFTTSFEDFLTAAGIAGNGFIPLFPVHVPVP